MYKIVVMPLAISICREIDGAWIPQDPANSDYQQYLAWLEEGNTPEEWNPDASD